MVLNELGGQPTAVPKGGTWREVPTFPRAPTEHARRQTQHTVGNCENVGDPQEEKDTLPLRSGSAQRPGSDFLQYSARGGGGGMGGRVRGHKPGGATGETGSRAPTWRVSEAS